MADTKISALTVATTPLAGTEVLPIVQSGVTKQVSVANLTAGRAVSADSLTLTGSPLPATSGGTGQSSYAVGDLLYASTTTALSKLADVATGNALISGGVGVAPSWGKINLTTHVSGTLPVANGGTGVTSFSAGQILYGSLSQSANLFWDNTNVRFGVGTSSPSYNVDVIQNVSLSGRIRANTAGVGTYAQLLLETGNTNTGVSQAYVKASSTNGGNSGINIILGAQPDGGAAYDLVVGEGTAKTWRPGTDNTTTLGSSSYQWSTIYTKDNLVQGTAAKGINFTANSAAAGMTSQLLNWYEEGTWTPVDGSGAGLTLTNNATARYTRIGRMVYLSCDVTYPSTANGSIMLISGFPFTTAVDGGGAIGYTDYAPAAQIFAQVTSGSQGIRLQTNGGSTLTNATVSTKRFQFSFEYSI